MKCAILLAALVAVACAMPIDEDMFTAFKAQHNKIYKDAQEESTRKAIFFHNQAMINAHNAAGHSYTLGMNEFGDLSHAEFSRMYLQPARDHTKVNRTGSTFISNFDVKDLPTSVDWRTKGCVTGVKNQGQCGSCWAFSTTGSLEGQHQLKTGSLVSLSEQNLVDCSHNGNQGCNGGLMDTAFDYIKTNGGIDTETSYPYVGVDGTCKFTSSNVGATCTGYVDVKSGDESALEQASATIGPISVAIDASHSSFQFYKSGVYDPALCSSTRLDHGVLVVGYGSENGKNFWLVKNSWGPSWGQSGYINMIKDHKNKCGIATSASYPLV